MNYSTVIKRTTITAVTLILAMGMAFAAEPKMDDYTAVPVASSNSVPPNIMIILDNSGSMQNLAYEDYPYQGEPYNNLTGTGISARADDAEERKITNDDPNLWSSDLVFPRRRIRIARYPHPPVMHRASVLRVRQSCVRESRAGQTHPACPSPATSETAASVDPACLRYRCFPPGRFD